MYFVFVCSDILIYYKIALSNCLFQMNTSKWVKFFTEAGLPTSVATKYAVVFTDHRIQIDMLVDLTKEILYDMGIKTMGDVIAILRHAKNVHDEKTKEKLLGTVDDEIDTPKRMISLTRKSQTGTSISDRIIANTGSGPSGLLKRPIQSNSLQSPTKVIRLGSSSNEQSSSSIFNRLGAPTKTTDIQSGSVFLRLGGANTSDSSSSSSSSRIVSLNSKAQSSSTFNSIRPTNMLIKKSLTDTNVSNKVVIRTNTSNPGMRNDSTGIFNFYKCKLKLTFFSIYRNQSSIGQPTIRSR